MKSQKNGVYFFMTWYYTAHDKPSLYAYYIFLFLFSVSLYPFIQLITDLPCGHPVILTSSDLPNEGNRLTREQLREYFGIAKITIAPPKSLRYEKLLIMFLNNT